MSFTHISIKRGELFLDFSQFFHTCFFFLCFIVAIRFEDKLCLLFTTGQISTFFFLASKPQPKLLLSQSSSWSEFAQFLLFLGGGVESMKKWMVKTHLFLPHTTIQPTESTMHHNTNHPIFMFTACLCLCRWSLLGTTNCIQLM